MGPRLFILYTADLADVAAAHDVNIHSYADDTQLHLHCQREDTTMAIQRLEMCISDVSPVSYTHLTLPTIYSV